MNETKCGSSSECEVNMYVSAFYAIHSLIFDSHGFDLDGFNDSPFQFGSVDFVTCLEILMISWCNTIVADIDVHTGWSPILLPWLT